jgi:hypothetical protein
MLIARPLTALIAIAFGTVTACDGEEPCPIDMGLDFGSDGGAVATEPAPAVSFESLLMAGLDPATLARPDALSYRARMASSYDRASIAPGEPGWFGNADAAHFLREERVGDRTEHVLLDVDGPAR